MFLKHTVHDSRVATYYTKVMERVITRGDAFVTTEIDRLERLLGKTAFLHRAQCTTYHMWSDRPTVPMKLIYHPSLIIIIFNFIKS